MTNKVQPHSVPWGAICTVDFPPTRNRLCSANASGKFRGYRTERDGNRLSEFVGTFKVTNYVDWRMKMNKCDQCKYKADFAGNYIECVLLHRFVDYEYWHNEKPEGCQFKAKQENNVDEK